MRTQIDRLRRRYRDHDWIPVTTGMSGAAVWRLAGSPAYYLKVCSAPAGVAELIGEADRLDWLAGQGFPVPEVVDVAEVADADRSAWLVTTEVPGRTAAEPWPVGARAAVVDALADLAGALHAAPVGRCPFDRSLAVALLAARRAAATGLVDLARLDAQRRGWTVDRLLSELDAASPAAEAAEEPVVCHGDLCLPNVLLDPDTLVVTGMIDVGRLGVADRHADLALVTRSLSSVTLNPQYGPSHADRFLARYGAHYGGPPADPDQIAFYRLLDEFF